MSKEKRNWKEFELFDLSGRKHTYVDRWYVNFMRKFRIRNISDEILIDEFPVRVRETQLDNWEWENFVEYVDWTGIEEANEKLEGGTENE